MLSSLSKQQQSVESTNVVSIAKRAGHPVLDSPYFAEYPLRVDGGVPLFDKRLSYESYCLDEGSPDSVLYAYISSLVSYATNRDEIPVFKFNRSLFRSQWLKKHFLSRNILVLRRPIDVWRSMVMQGSYYYASLCLILGQNQTHPFLAPIAKEYRIPFFRSDDILEERRYYLSYAARNWMDLYSMFYLFYISSIIHNLVLSDCIIDMDRVNRSSDGQRSALERLRRIGFEIALSDFHMRCYEELSRTEQKYVENEPTLRSFIAHRMPSSLRIDSETWSVHQESLGQYFREVCAEFAQ